MEKYYKCFDKILKIDFVNLDNETINKIEFWINKFTPSVEINCKKQNDIDLFLKIENDENKMEVIEEKNSAYLVGKVNNSESNIGKYVSQLFQRILIDDGIVFIHASGVVKDNKGIIIVGDYGQGKTSVALECIIKDDDVKLLSDNGLAIQNNKIVGYTKSISLRQVNDKMLSKLNIDKKFNHINRVYFDYEVEGLDDIEIVSIIIPHINAEDNNNYLVNREIAKLYLYEKLSLLIKGETLLFNCNAITKSYANRKNLNTILKEVELLVDNIGLKYFSCSFDELVENVLKEFEVDLYEKRL